MNQNLKELKKNGWILIKNFFDQEYCDNLRNQCFESTKSELKDKDLLSNPNLNHLFLNEKLITILTEILGEKPIYFGDSTFQIASVAGGIATGFHKDSLDRKNSNGADWQDEYSLIRIGIYLQNHKHFSEGLVVRTGSHKTTDLKFGKKVNVPSEKGDLIIWYLTTTHSGNAKRVFGTDNALLMPDKKNNKILNYIYKLLLRPSQKDRVALFATFGKNDNHLKRYLEYLKHRKYMLDIWKNQNFDKLALEKIEFQNLIKVIDMKDEIIQMNENNFVEYDFDNFQKYNF